MLDSSDKKKKQKNPHWIIPEVPGARLHVFAEFRPKSVSNFPKEHFYLSFQYPVSFRFSELRASYHDS